MFSYTLNVGNNELDLLLPFLEKNTEAYAFYQDKRLAVTNCGTCDSNFYGS